MTLVDEVREPAFTIPIDGHQATLDAEAGRHGTPIARFSSSQCDNDRQLITVLVARAAGAMASARS